VRRIQNKKLIVPSTLTCLFHCLQTWTISKCCEGRKQSSTNHNWNYIRFAHFIDTVTRGLHHYKRQTRLLASCLQETHTQEYACRTFCRGYSYWNRPQLVLNTLKSNLPKSSRQNINAKTWQPLSDHKDFGFMLSDAPYMKIRWTVCRLHIRRDTAFLRQFQIRINMDLRDHFWKSEFWKFSHFLVAFVFWCVGIFRMLCSENS
jgi:hypothetical protein